MAMMLAVSVSPTITTTALLLISGPALTDVVAATQLALVLFTSLGFVPLTMPVALIV